MSFDSESEFKSIEFSLSDWSEIYCAIHDKLCFIKKLSPQSNWLRRLGKIEREIEKHLRENIK